MNLSFFKEEYEILMLEGFMKNSLVILNLNQSFQSSL